jgi:hypothetical protein
LEKLAPIILTAFWTWFGAACATHALRNGQFGRKSGIVRRHERPWAFWSTVLLLYGVSAISLFALIYTALPPR